MSYSSTTKVPFVTSEDIATMEAAHPGITKLYKMTPTDNAINVFNNEVARINATLPSHHCVITELNNRIYKKDNQWVIVVRIMD